MTRDVDGGLRAVGREDPNILVEILVVFGQRDERAIGREDHFGVVIPTRMDHLDFARRKIEAREIREIAHEEERLAIGRRDRATIVVRPCDERRHIESHRVSPSTAVELRILFLRWLFGRLLSLTLRGLLLRLRFCGLRRFGCCCGLRRFWCSACLGLRFGLRLDLHFRFRLGLRHLRLLQLAALARLAARFSNLRREERIARTFRAIVHVARKVERQTIGRPRDVTLATFAFGDTARRRLVFGGAHEDVAIGDERHRLSIGRQRDFARSAPDLLELAIGERIGRGGEGEFLRRCAILRKIDPPEIAKDTKHRGLAISRDRETVDVCAVEIRESLARVERVAHLRAEEVERARAAIGDVDVFIRRDEARQSIVAVVLRQRGEALRRHIKEPHVAVVGAVVAAARPARAAAFEENARAVSRRVGRTAERVVESHRRATFDGHDVRPRRAVKVALDRCIDEGDRLSFEHADRRERERRVDFGDLAKIAAVGGHRPEVLDALTIAFKDDARAIGRKAAARFVCGIRGEPRGRAACRRGAPKITSPREDDRRTIGRQRGIARQIDVRGRCATRTDCRDERRSGAGCEGWAQEVPTGGECVGHDSMQVVRCRLVASERRGWARCERSRQSRDGPIPSSGPQSMASPLRRRRMTMAAVGQSRCGVCRLHVGRTRGAPKKHAESSSLPNLACFSADSDTAGRRTSPYFSVRARCLCFLFVPVEFVSVELWSVCYEPESSHA